MSSQATTNRLPRSYFLLAHICLGSAALLLATTPSTYAGFFYQPRTIALVHLVTLGWITSSIFGALYMIGPMALRLKVVENRIDKLIFWAFAIGLLGMVTHFWLDKYSGMVWSALLVWVTPVVLGLRFAGPLAGSPIASGARLHLGLAFINMVGAGFLGILVGLSKTTGSPSFVGLTGVYAHLHFAALGWAAMLVLGVAYRLVPMVLPAKVPSGAGPIASAVALELAVVGLVVGFLWAPGLIGPSAVLAALGFLIFVGQLLWMLRNRRPPARHLPRPDFALAHLGAALLYLLATAGLGLALSLGAFSEVAALRWAAVYGVFGLVGFLAQMVTGMSVRLWPLYSWMRAKDNYPEQVAELPGPSTLLVTWMSVWVAVLWLLAVPLLALGLYRESAGPLMVAGWFLFAATAVSAWHQVRQMNEATP